MSRHCGPNNGGTIVQPGATNHRRTARRSLGFTLIELVVVISLILLLVGLTMSVGLAVRSNSETRQTENVLILLDQAVKQWQIAADRQLSWGMNGTPVVGTVYDVQGDIDGSVSAEEQLVQLLSRISTNSAAREVLAQIDDDFLLQERDDNDELVIRLVDPWGKRISLLHPGRVVDPVNFGDNPIEADLDGTVRTEHEKDFGIALNRILLFVSAGPDGEFGDLEAPTGSPEFQATQDNVYSYKPGSDQ